MKIIRASLILKQIISMITTMAKSKTMALKSKTRAIKTRLIIFSLLRNRKFLMSTITDKLRSLTGQEDNKYLQEEDESKSPTEQSNYNSMSHESLPPHPTQIEFLVDEEEEGYYVDEDDKYPDLTHSLFEDGGVSVIDLVKNSKPEGEVFRLEDEIDHVADLFIQRFHQRMRLQKQLSLKRNQEMLDNSP